MLLKQLYRKNAGDRWALVPHKLKEAQILLNFTGDHRGTALINPLPSNSWLDSPRSEAREDLVTKNDTLGTGSLLGSFPKGL